MLNFTQNMRVLPYAKPIWILAFFTLAACEQQPPPQAATTVKYPPQSLADQRNLISKVRISQDSINTRKKDFKTIFYAGKHIFSNRFTREDHYGEGKEGPRRSQQEISGRGNYPFLRFNGLDSQSCLECHLAIGFAPEPTSQHPLRFAKQPGITAGGAGFASNAFGFANFGCKQSTVKTKDNNDTIDTYKASNTPCDVNKPTFGMTRNPPHAFGAGYTQKLAQEMTITLQDLLEKAKTSPGKSVALKAKGISFGSVVATTAGKIDTSKSNIEGVSNDLVVRPFQWKGLTSNLRNFITGAMNFHFSVQPTESMLGGTMEDDKDDLVNEIDAGEISAVAIFLSHLRPPVQYDKGFSAKRVKRGKKLFTDLDCASCHTPSLTIDNPLVTVRDPRNDATMMKSMQKMGMQEAIAKQEPQQPSLTVTQAALPVMMEYALLKEAKKQGMSEHDIEKKIQTRFGGYTRNLNLDDGPAETLPRLPTGKDKRSKIKVPLYSDLKRHKMGAGLAEPFPQTTDGGKDHQVPGDEFLTRPLWGLADTAPWLHDGRALSLTEAIVLHKSDGSEASDSVDKFNALSNADKKALITFLSTLHLPAYNP